MTYKILMVATIAGTLEDFLTPYVRYFRGLGWQVDGMAADITANSACVAEFDTLWDLQLTRNPLDLKNLIAAVTNIQKTIAKENYDLVHVHTPIAAFVTRYAIAQLTIKQKPQVIYTAHGFHFHQQGNPLTNAIFLSLEKLAGKWTNYLITINREDEAAAKKYRLLPPERIFYTPGIGLELAQYDRDRVSAAQISAIHSELGLTAEDKLLLCVAEFTANKRHRDQIIALQQLNRPEVHLAFAGSGTTQPEVEKLTQELGLESQVHFLGFRYDIPALICASEALLLTSQREGLPRSIMEAFCAATPVIGTNIRGIQDLLSDDCGILFEVGDTKALSKAMRAILERPEQARQIGQNGLKKVISYDVQKIIQLYADIYTQALETT